MRTAGIVLIVIGALMMVYTGFNYVTEKKVIDVGPLEVNKQEEHPVRWSPIVGGVLLIGGIALMMSSKKKGV
jgi:uncharacterized membrane protein